MNYLNNQNLKILIIGDLMLDHYIYGNCSRISPEAPVQVVEIKNEQHTLGGAGNVLKNLQALNCKADIISVVGDDDNAKIVLEQLGGGDSLNNNIITDRQRCTTIKSRVMVSKHQLIRLDKEDTHLIDDSIVQQIIERVKKNIKNYDIVLLSDYGKGLLSNVLLNYIFEICRTAGIKTILDPKGADFLKYRGVNIIKPNKKEAIIASGISITDNDSLKAACIKIKELTGCDDVVITMSEEGIAMYSDNQLSIIPTKAIDIVDVTGAGDTVLASLGVALAAGKSLKYACDFANHAAAIVVSKAGSATATLADISEKFPI